MPATIAGARDFFAPGVGGQVLWRPTGWLSILGNQYFGTGTLGTPDRKRVHTDDSIMVKYHDNPSALVSKAAASLTMDAGCEWGGGGDCSTQYFLGFMAYHRVWFDHDRFAVTFGGGAITNPGRYLLLLPPINGATASSGTPYFPESPGLGFKAWDMQQWQPLRDYRRLEPRPGQGRKSGHVGTDAEALIRRAHEVWSCRFRQRRSGNGDQRARCARGLA